MIPRKLATLDRPLLAPKLFYFTIAGASTAIGPFFALFYQSLGIPSPQIGILAGLPSLIILFGAALWTGLADYTLRHKPILLIALIGSAICLWLVLHGSGFWALLPVVCLYYFFLAPVQPLVR